VREAIFNWLFVFGTAAAVWPVRARAEAPSCVPVIAAVSPGFRETTWQIRPIKKKVGRAVTPTMDKINNPWFVLSQIVVPLSGFLFSLIYVRRHRASQAAQGATQASNPKEVRDTNQAGP
jgi:hypothetical protein